MFIYRPEYYKIEEWDDDEAGPTTDQAEIDVAKYRHGETGYCRVGCQLRFMRFMDLENLRDDITQRYFRNKEVPELKNNSLPIINPKEAFPSVNFYEKEDDSDSDVPF